MLFHVDLSCALWLVPRPSQSHGFSLDSDEREGEETAAKPKAVEDSRERRERPEETPRSGWERRTTSEDRRKKRDDSEPRLFMACDDSQDPQHPPEGAEKSGMLPHAHALFTDHVAYASLGQFCCCCSLERVEPDN